jgi:hypothetical protein
MTVHLGTCKHAKQQLEMPMHSMPSFCNQMLKIHGKKKLQSVEKSNNKKQLVRQKQQEHAR